MLTIFTKGKWIITDPCHHLTEWSHVPWGVGLFGCQDSPGLRAAPPVFPLDCALHAVTDSASSAHHFTLTPSMVADPQEVPNKCVLNKWVIFYSQVIPQGIMEISWWPWARATGLDCNYKQQGSPFLRSEIMTQVCQRHLQFFSLLSPEGSTFGCDQCKCQLFRKILSQILLKYSALHLFYIKVVTTDFKSGAKNIQLKSGAQSSPALYPW